MILLIYVVGPWIRCFLLDSFEQAANIRSEVKAWKLTTLKRVQIRHKECQCCFLLIEKKKTKAKQTIKISWQTKLS